MAPLAGVAMVLPGLLWACLDYRPWPWDQAQYAEYTLRTLGAFDEGPLAGLAAMGVLMAVRAPGLTWLGAPFALLEDFLGRTEPALLCATLAFQAGTLLACYWSACRVSGSRLTALAVTAFIGSTPLFVAMNHQYLVEPLQTHAVALSFLLALCSHRLSRVALLAALSGVAALAMAAKSTSPLYCGLPLLVATAVLLARRPAVPGRLARSLEVPLLLLALFGVALVANWYATHFAAMAENARQATVGPVALGYGTPAGFPSKLWHWISQFGYALFFPSPLVLLAAALAAGAAIARPRRSIRGDRGAGSPSPEAPAGWVVVAAAAGLAAAFVAYSLQINEDPRFLQPLLPATAILLAWLCSRRQQRAASAALLAAALVQFILVYGYALGLSPKASSHHYLQAVERDGTQRSRLQRVVKLTCDPRRPLDVNLVGVQYAWMNASSLNFYAVVAQARQPVCRYTSLEYPGNPQGTALKKLDVLGHHYYIAVAPDKMLPPDFVNREASAALARVATSREWEYVSTIDDTVVIYRSKRY